MKNICFSSTLMWKAPLSQIFQTAHFFRADGIEFWAQQFESKHYSATECLTFMSQDPLRIFVHSKSWDLNFASMNKSIREASLNEIRSSIDLAVKLHASEVTVHPPHETLCENPAYYQELVYRGLNEILRYGQKAGIRVSLEIMEKLPKELMTTQVAAKELTRDLYREFSYTVDTAHCTDEKELAELIARLPGVSKLHISNRRGKKYHTALSDGDFSFREIFPLLTKADIPMVIEGFDDSDHYTMLKDNMNYIQSLKECQS